VLAGGLGFVEGPAVLIDGTIVFCHGTEGSVLAFRGSGCRVLARTNGFPNGIAVAADGTLFVAQAGAWTDGDNGGWRRAPGDPPGIQRVELDGSVSDFCVEIDGIPMRAPNDLTFGPDGRLYFTDPGDGDYEAPEGPGRIYAIGPRGGELIVELEAVFPNGLAFDPAGKLVWSESTTRRICRLEGTTPSVVCELPSECVPDGFAIAADGRLFVATVLSRGVTVLSAAGHLIGHIAIGALSTNCAFLGRTLVVTAVYERGGRNGSGILVAIETDADPLPLSTGYL
jgi:gluconolactonase